MKHVGILGHSAEGTALCFQTMVRDAARHLGEQDHPQITLNILPMGPTMPLWERDDLSALGELFSESMDTLARAGADLFVCPDNTAHLALAAMPDPFPIPGLHIVDVVRDAMIGADVRKAGLLGTKWTMTSDLYRSRCEAVGIDILVPSETDRTYVNTAIFDELCNGEFRAETKTRFVHIIEALKADGADCVILGCTEIPLLVVPDNSPLPTMDSTRLLARAAIAHALGLPDPNGTLSMNFSA